MVINPTSYQLKLRKKDRNKRVKGADLNEKLATKINAERNQSCFTDPCDEDGVQDV
jgi:hypothetical protein